MLKSQLQCSAWRPSVLRSLNCWGPFCWPLDFQGLWSWQSWGARCPLGPRLVLLGSHIFVFGQLGFPRGPMFHRTWRLLGRGPGSGPVALRSWCPAKATEVSQAELCQPRGGGRECRGPGCSPRGYRPRPRWAVIFLGCSVLLSGVLFCWAVFCVWPLVS